jgi:hypothetical protein
MHFIEEYQSIITIESLLTFLASNAIMPLLEGEYEISYQAQESGGEQCKTDQSLHQMTHNDRYNCLFSYIQK